MKITRLVNNEIMEFELTTEEISDAHDEHVTNFMKNILIRDFDLDEKTAEEYAVIAYNKYCQGDGKTEYECIEEAYEEYEEELEIESKNDDYDDRDE